MMMLVVVVVVAVLWLAQQFRHDDGMVRFLEAEPEDWTRPPFALHLQSYDVDQAPRRLATSAKARETRVMEAIQATMARLYRNELLVGHCCEAKDGQP